MERRELLRSLAAGAGAGAARGLLGEDLLALGRAIHDRIGTASRPAVLTRHANATVIAAAERIIPASETPGATDAGVDLFIDRMLADWHAPAERARFVAGLRELDALSRSRHRRDFVDCAAEEQAALLTAFDDEVEALRSVAAAERQPRDVADPNGHWFAMLKYLTVWGYFTSEVGMRQTLHAYPLPGRYEACAPYEAGSPTRSPS